MADSNANREYADASTVRQDVAVALRHLAHTSKDVTWVYSRDLREVLFISDAYQRIWGRSLDSLRDDPRSWMKALHPDDAARVQARAEEGIRSGQRYQDEYRIVRPDGDVRVIRHLGFPLRDEEGAIWAAVGIARDITVEHRAGKEAEDYAHHMQLLAETAMAFVELPHDAPIYELVGAKMRALFGKESYVVVTELSRDERTYETRALLGFGDALAPLREKVGSGRLMAGEVVEATRMAWLTGKLVFVEGGMAQLLGSEFPAEAAQAAEEALGIKATYQIGFSRGGRVFGGVTVALRNAEVVPKPEFVEAFARQATVSLERRESHLRLRASESQLLHAQKMEAIGRLAGGVAHDLNNTLGTVVGYADALQSELDGNNPIRADIDQILLAAERATRLTEQLLAFSRKQVTVPRAMDVGELIANLEPTLMRLVGQEVHLETRCAQASPRTYADPGQLEQLLMNLVLNARDAMPGGGEVVIEVRRADLDEGAGERLSLAPGAYVLIAVTDTGCGIDSETQQRIFEPFFTTKAEGHGTGLGLSMVYGIASQNGGKVTVSSEPGHGCVFRVYLPWVEGKLSAEQSDDHRSSSQHNGETVLIAEDEALLRNLMVRVLEGKGYRVLAASDGEHALEICQAHEGPVHLLVSDIVMPRLGGRELAQRVSELLPSTKILLTSGYMGSSAAQQGEGLGGAAFIAKPFTATAFLTKVRQVLAAV